MHWIDPDHLPKTEGTVNRFLINPHGEIDGILLAGDLEVHVPAWCTDRAMVLRRRVT